MNRSRVTGDLASHGNIFVDIANDRVGIGSTIPTTKLDVSGKAQIEGLLVDTVDPVINVGSAYAYKYGYFGDANKHALTVRGNEASLEVFASEQSYHAGSILLRGGNEGFGFVNNSSDDRLELISFTASANSFALHNGGANLSNYDKVFVANKNGSIDLYHNGSKKFETSSAGARVTGTLRTGDGSTISFSDNVNLEDSSGSGNNRVKLGNGDDLQLYHDGTRSHLSNTTGELRIGQGGTNVELYHSSAKKFETTSTGVEITGTNILLNDNSAITGTPNTYNYGRGSGSTSGLSLYGGESAIEVVSNDDGTHGGSILIRTTTDGAGFVYNPTDNALEITMFTPSGAFAIHNNGSNTTQDTQLRVVKDGAVELNYDGTKKFETSADGIILSSTDAGSSANPEIKLFRNSASPANADYLGQIKFAGESSTGVERNYAKITGKILDVTNGSEDGILEFAHIKGGSQTITGRWRSDSLQLLNGTSLTVAGTSDFTGDATFNGGAGAVTVAAGSDISFTNSSASNQWTGDNLAKIQHFNSVLYISGGTGGIIFREAGTSRWRINGDGHFIPEQGDGTLDIGQNAKRVRNGYFDTLYGNGANITNVDADTLDGQQGSYYRNASNLNAGTIDDARLPATITSSITGNSGSTDALKIIDTRNDGARVPNDYADHKVTAEFTNQIINGWWSTLTSKGWADGYAPWQLVGYSDTGQNINLYARFGHGQNNTWSSLYKIWHSGNDGTGSGLDADTLDGVQGASYLRSDANDTASGQITLTSSSQYPLTINGSDDGKIVLQGSTNPYIRFKEGTTERAYLQFNGDGNIYLWNQEHSRGLRLGSQPYFNDGSYRQIWHAGNDGSGSGLDADTVDGLQASSFLRVDTNDSVGSQVTFTSSSQYPLIIDGSDNGKIVVQGSDNPYIRFRNSADADKAYLQYNTTDSNVFYVWNQHHNQGLRIGSTLDFYHGSAFRTVWHSNNDGSGSGLDADLWDGNQFASYLNQALLTSSTVNFSRVNVTGSHGISNDGWFRNSTSGEGLYNTATTQHWYSDDDDYWNVAGGGSANGIRFRDEHAGTVRGYVYANNSNQIGFLQQGGSWSLRTETVGITKLGSNGYQLRDGNNNRNLYYYGNGAGDLGISGFDSNGGWRFQLYGNSSGQYGFLDANWGGWDLRKYVNGAFYADEGSGLQRVWNAGNDGSGSGLDADTLDGSQANAFVRSGAQSSVSGWHISAYRNGSGTSPHIYMSHSSGYGFHVNTYNTDGNYYALELHNSAKVLFVVKNDGRTEVAGNVEPAANNTYDLGQSSRRWRNLYINDLQLSNESRKETGGNDVDGTWGNYTIQEGEDDLFLINNRSGKKYKFNLTEVS